MEPVRTLGIFVGGASRRMGTPKGRLLHEGQTLVERAIGLAQEAGLTPCVVGDVDVYDDLTRGIERVGDNPRGIGPIGGIRSMLLRGSFVALACDMPFVGLTELHALAHAEIDAPILAPKARRWEPLFARYRTSALPHLEAMLEVQDHRLQSLCNRCAREFHVDPACLEDWDCPTDLP